MRRTKTYVAAGLLEQNGVKQAGSGPRGLVAASGAGIICGRNTAASEGQIQGETLAFELHKDEFKNVLHYRDNFNKLLFYLHFTN